MSYDSRRRRFSAALIARDPNHQNELTRRLTDLDAVARVVTLQTIRTSLSRAGIPL